VARDQRIRPAGWVSGDAVYGQHSRLRAAIEELGMSYVLAVPVSQHVITEDPRLAGKHRAGDVIAALPAQAWRRRSAGDGAKGERRYDWARTRIHGVNHPDSVYYLLARRSLSDPTDLAYYLCHTSPAGHPDGVGYLRRKSLGHRGNLPNREGRNRALRA